MGRDERVFRGARRERLRLRLKRTLETTHSGLVGPDAALACARAICSSATTSRRDEKTLAKASFQAGYLERRLFPGTTGEETHIIRPYSPKNAESMNASPRIGPAVPAKKNRIPSERYKLINPTFACEPDDEADGFEVCAGEEERAEGVGEGVMRVDEVCFIGEATAGRGGAAPVAPRGVGGGGNGNEGDGKGGMEDFPTRGEEVEAGLGAGGEP